MTMNIIGPDELVFGVEDLAGCTQYLQDYGLVRVDLVNVAAVDGGRFEAMDGTAVVLRRIDDPGLPPVLGPGPGAFLRETIYGVGDEATLDAIETELRKDRAVKRTPDGVLHSVDDSGIAIGFQCSIRRAYVAAAVLSNAPGTPAQRPLNVTGVNPEAKDLPLPRTLSHLVYFVPDFAKAEAFYTQRLGFRVSDRFIDVGPFLRAPGSSDHHALFMIETPVKLLGLEHFAFHMGSITEVMQRGTHFVAKGYQSFWGPGRHLYGSNWFWYFNSPLGCRMEFDADMDQNDDQWVARAAPLGADQSQLFLFETRQKWLPGGPPTADEKH